MSWLMENWFWVLFGGLFIGMHLFGHGCHGGHGKHSKHGTHDEKSHTDKHSGNKF